MSPLLERFQAWLAQKPPEPSVMAPVGSRARLASDTQADRESRAEILRALGMLPVPGAQLAQVAGDLAAESEITPLGVAKAAAGAIMPVKAGPGKINVFGEASKVNPQAQRIYEELKKQGLSEALARLKSRTLPMLSRSGELLPESWAPAMRPLPRFSPELHQAKNDIYSGYVGLTPKHGESTIPFEKLYDPAETHQLLTAYPELAKIPVTFTTKLPAAQGFMSPGETPSMTVSARTPYLGAGSLGSTLAHEGTHLVQNLRRLPIGSGPEAVKFSREEILPAVAEMSFFGGYDPNTPLAELNYKASMVEKRADMLGGGLPGYQSQAAFSEKPMQDYLVKLLWNERMNRLLKNSDYKLYRAMHGEQIAEGAGRYANALPAKFTAALSKQPLSMDDLAQGDYALRMAKLYDKIGAGLIPDPSTEPYTLYKP